MTRSLGVWLAPFVGEVLDAAFAKAQAGVLLALDDVIRMSNAPLRGTGSRVGCGRRAAPWRTNATMAHERRFPGGMVRGISCPGTS